MKENKYTKSLAKNQVSANISYARYSEKRFTQISKPLYGDAMLVSLSGAQVEAGNQQKHLFSSCMEGLITGNFCQQFFNVQIIGELTRS